MNSIIKSLAIPALAAPLAVAALSTVLEGCDTQAYCFENCNTGSTTAASTSTGQGGAGGSGFPDGSTVGAFMETTSTGSTCELTNGGVEICDHLDNDCNGTIDDIAGIDYDDPKTCGTCDTNCYTAIQNVDPTTVQCAPSSQPGTLPGQCSGTCAADYYDIDGDGNCEYYCVESASDDKTCDNKDDDCDGLIDEDVDLCTSTTDCGKCGGNCVVGNGTPECVHTGTDACSTANTLCKIKSCDPGWIDLDQSYATGCEYQCTPTDGGAGVGVEVCGDNIDNDCDGKIDSADDLSGDPQIGVQCFGGTKGECADISHAGTTQCVNNQVTCVGANVIHPAEVAEICDGKDNDCDGVNDNNPSDAGAACGVSNIFPCTLGTMQCVNAALKCVGEKDPVAETCNGKDDNCDGTIDKTNGQDPPDSVGACNVPGFTTNPNSCETLGTCTSPCHAGTKSCTGGTVQCNNSQQALMGAQDTCGVDANCDGALTNQPDKMTDVHHCGSCSNDCTAGAVHANWSCMAGSCHFDGCQTGFYDNGGPGDAMANDQKCGYACTFIQANELCNGQDDNCNGVVDENPVKPSPVQACGVSPAASSPECTTGVSLACVSGSWKCTFPANVCNAANGCAGTAETCDALDNNCNGQLNENVPNFGQACASDDAAPVPGDGACRTLGNYVCNGGSATKCSATKANCATLPGGCTENCDGIDNDCDGLIDEPFSSKGTNATNFYKPNVTKIGSSLWIMQYEASRPKFDTTKNPKGSDATVPGSGNGYWTSAPPGTTLDRTPACSEPTHIPWFNVTGTEVEQTCAAMGGVICSTTEWQGACTATAGCKWGYDPRNAACTSPFVAGSKFCNLGPSFDFSSTIAGDQDGLLPTASSSLQNCSADWSGLLGNTTAQSEIFDITGNLREIVKNASNQYKLMGGAFNTASEDGAQCGFTFYTVDQNFKFFDTGFRCCFDSDPTQ